MSRRDGRKWGVTVQPSLRDGFGIWYALLPSDKSLGYCQTTLRVEILAVSKISGSRNVGNEKHFKPGASGFPVKVGAQNTPITLEAI